MFITNRTQFEWALETFPVNVRKIALDMLAGSGREEYKFKASMYFKFRGQGVFVFDCYAPYFYPFETKVECKSSVVMIATQGDFFRMLSCWKVEAIHLSRSGKSIVVHDHRGKMFFDWTGRDRSY